MFFAVKGNSDMIRIAVCDDDWTIREELSRLIKEQAPKADIVEYKSGEEMVMIKKILPFLFLILKWAGCLAWMLQGVSEKGRTEAARGALLFL